PTTGDYLEFVCPDCGHYRVSRSLLTIQRGRVFDVELTRRAIERMPRLDGVPTLSTVDEDLLREPRQ
ncbi:hypothetical protein, partial [Bowmanella yangjiangensis]